MFFFVRAAIFDGRGLGTFDVLKHMIEKKRMFCLYLAQVSIVHVQYLV